MALPAAASSPIEEDTIRQMGADLSSIIAQSTPDATVDDSQVKKLKDAIDALLGAAELADIPPSQRATVCVALCGAFERCQVAAVERFRDAIWEDHRWSRLFGIYLNFFDKAKPKSMRQVLLVSTAVLSKNTALWSSQYPQEAVSRIVDLISRDQNHRKVKPALQALAHFISKGLISVDQLIDLSGKCVQDSEVHVSRAKTGQTLLAKFLIWVLHHDTALAAGHLVAHFLEKGSDSQAFNQERETGLPIWAEPFETCIRASPESIQEFRHHVFPNVFRLSFDDYIQFLHHLRMRRYLNAIPSSEAEANTDYGRPDDAVEISILFAALQAGKDIGMVKDIDRGQSKTIELHAGALLVPNVVLGKLMAHSTPDVRLAGLSLLVSSTSITKPISKGSIQCLRDNLFHLHADTDANFRGELLSQIQRLFDRLRSSTATLSKAIMGNTAALKSISTTFASGNLGPGTDERCFSDILSYHLEFVSWYLSFISSELRPTASYQRHITALKALTIIMKSGIDPIVSHKSLSKQAQGDKRWHHRMNILTPGLVRSLLDLLLDPFDEVHVVAASILRLKYEGNGTPKSTSSELLQFIGRAEKIMLRTGRADHADGVARAYELLYSQSDDDMISTNGLETQGQWWRTKWAVINHLMQELERTLELARQDLSVAVNQYPMHGILASLRFIVERPDFYATLATPSPETLKVWKSLHLRLYKCFDDAWTCVRNILCNDAPEGYVPDDMEDNTQITTKDILSYSWRALKEASMLLRAVISRAPFEQKSLISILDSSEIESLGTLTFTQLINLRHRGAFSAVAQTFAVCCQRCCKVDDDRTRNLLLSWHQDTMLYIRDKSPITTRRSAGIPSLITGIISADPESALFKRVLEELLSEASLDVDISKFDESRIPQVHALNCIKDIFTTTKLVAASEAYLGRGLDLAATKLGSQFWPIRNCGLMLFKALIERLLGTGETQHWNDQRFTRTCRLSYDRFPNLLDIVVRLITLNKSSHSPSETSSTKSPRIEHGMEAVFPALQILQQAPPPDYRQAEIRKLVLELTRTPHWHIRDMAARTYVSGLNSHDYLDSVQSLLAEKENFGQVAVHGKLLSLKYALRVHLTPSSVKASPRRIDSILEDILGHFQHFYGAKLNPMIRSTYLDVINEFGKVFLMTGCSSSRNARLEKITRRLDEDRRTSILDCLSRSQRSSVTGAAMLRRSIAIFLVIRTIGWRDNSSELGGSQYQQPAFESLLQDLSRHDPDNYCLVLGELSNLVDRAPSDFLQLSKSQIVECIHQISQEDPEVKVTSRACMVSLLSDQATKISFFTNVSRQTASQTIEGLELSSLYGPPMECEASLPLYGMFLDHKSRLLVNWDAEFLQQMSRYVRIISRALNETNAFDIRHAAAHSLASLQHIYTTPPSPPLLRLTLLVYDALNDDDDDIRELAASVAIRVVKGPGYNPDTPAVVPLLAARQLAEHFVAVYSNSSVLFEEAIRRFMSGVVCSAMFPPSPPPQPDVNSQTQFQEQLAEARMENSALFAQEKQNLYIDETREIELWAGVLERLLFEADPSSSFADAFEQWVVDGIRELTVTTRAEVDGSLGWSSNPEVFTLGMRVLYGAKVLLKWSSLLQVRDDVPFMASREDYLALLMGWAEVAKERGLHGLWLESIA